MSVVVIGENECMVCQYEKICKKHGCKAKVFVKGKNGLKKKIGNPDLIVLFTNHGRLFMRTRRENLNYLKA